MTFRLVMTINKPLLILDKSVIIRTNKTFVKKRKQKQNSTEKEEGRPKMAYKLCKMRDDLAGLVDDLGNVCREIEQTRDGLPGEQQVVEFNFIFKQIESQVTQMKQTMCSRERFGRIKAGVVINLDERSAMAYG